MLGRCCPRVVGSADGRGEVKTAAPPSSIRFTAHGRPAPQGSKNSYAPLDKDGNPYRRENGGVVVSTVDSCKAAKPWMGQVRAAASWAFKGELIKSPVRLTCWFYFKRPTNHFGSGKNAARLKSSAPLHHCGTPDLDKLIRSIGDSITGVILQDDKQICVLGNETGKYWTTSGECCEVLIEILD
jgi:crossover junction endodeoxyribonuclease RusA